MANNLRHLTSENPTWWRRRSASERRLTILLLCGLAIVVVLAMVFGIMALKNIDSVHKDVCFTPECVQTASRVSDYIDPNVDPCDDFYRFSCGKFLNNTIIPDYEIAVNVFSIVDEEVQRRLRTSIEEEVQPNEKRHFKLLKTFYQNCINQTAINEKGLKPILEILERLGGWPVLAGDSWRPENFDWKESMPKFRKEGVSVNYFFSVPITYDFENNTKRVFSIDEPPLSVSRVYLIKGFNDTTVNAYFDYMVKIAVHFGADKTRAEKELKESLEFEMKLAHMSLPSEKRRNVTSLNNPMTVKELQTKYPSISWKTYLNAILYPNVQVEDDEMIIVGVPNFLKGLETLMAQTAKRIQANYVMWRVILDHIRYLSDDVRSIQLEYSTLVNGNTERVSRSKECVSDVTHALRHSAGALYVRKYFNEDSKNSAVEMVDGILKQFETTIKNLDWMDQKTRKSALEKANSMIKHIAYPEELLDDKKLEEFYHKLEITPGDYFQSVINFTFFKTENELNNFRKPVNKRDWITHSMPATINGFYFDEENSIQIPAGILQGNFFSHKRPRYMNYGAIGLVIGHEIVHAFDDIGSQYDKEGNLAEWWDPETKKKYLSKAKCIIEQYSNYTVKEVGLTLNGVNTQGENIADNGGVKVSYLAYQEWAKQNVPEGKLPGLDYTPSQLFWISTAHVFCMKIRPEILKSQIMSKRHTPDEFRIVGALSNRPEFAKDFKCPEGSRMNPIKKCSLW